MIILIRTPSYNNWPGPFHNHALRLKPPKEQVSTYIRILPKCAPRYNVKNCKGCSRAVLNVGATD